MSLIWRVREYRARADAPGFDIRINAELDSIRLYGTKGVRYVEQEQEDRADRDVSLSLFDK